MSLAVYASWKREAKKAQLFVRSSFSLFLPPHSVSTEAKKAERFVDLFFLFTLPPPPLCFPVFVCACVRICTYACTYVCVYVRMCSYMKVSCV